MTSAKIFKVGDRVRIDSDTAQMCLPSSAIGKVGVITKRDDDLHTWCVDVGDSEWPWVVHEQDLSLVEARE